MKSLIALCLLFSLSANAVDYTIQLTPAPNSVSDTEVSHISNRK